MDNLWCFMKDNPLKDKSFAFALRVVKLGRFLCSEHKEFVLAKCRLPYDCERVY